MTCGTVRGIIILSKPQCHEHGSPAGPHWNGILNSRPNTNFVIVQVSTQNQRHHREQKWKAREKENGKRGGKEQHTSAIWKEERCIWHKTLPLKPIQSHLVSSNTISVKQKFQSVVHRPPVHDHRSYGLPNKWHYTKNYEKVKKKNKQELQNCQDYRIKWVQITNLPLLYFPLYTSVKCIAQYYNHWTGTKIKWSTKHSAIFKWCGEKVWKNIIKDILLSLS